MIDAKDVLYYISNRFDSLARSCTCGCWVILSRGAYNATEYPALKFEMPEGMSKNCEWFPADPKLPNTNFDYSSTVVFGNIGGQLACGLFLVFFGCLGDFGLMRYKGLVLGWILASFCPLGEEKPSVPSAPTRLAGPSLAGGSRIHSKET